MPPIADDVGAEQFEVRVESADDVRIVRLIGELDLAAADAARAALEDANASDFESILVDIDELRFIDSTGLGLLLEAARRNNGSRRIQFTRGSGSVSELLELTGIDDALPFA